MPTNTNIPRTHVRVVRSDNREWPSMAVAYRELLGTQHELGHSEHMRLRAALRSSGVAMDRHGFTWRARGGAVAEETINWTDFTFGVEIELLAPFNRYDMQARLSDAGFSRWQVVHDGSLQSAPRFETMEVISPILQGEPGQNELRAVMTLIKAAGCKINGSCGLHIHVGVRGMAPMRVRRIAIAFLNAEQHFDSLVPPARLRSRYCQSNRERCTRSDQLALPNVTSISGLANAMNGGSSPQRYNSFRYYKLNFQSFVHHGTIEFRQHSGTVEADKACNWARLVTGFCARAAGQPQQEVGAEESFEQWLAACTDEAGQRFMTARRAKFALAARRRAA